MGDEHQRSARLGNAQERRRSQSGAGQGWRRCSRLSVFSSTAVWFPSYADDLSRWVYIDLYSLRIPSSLPPTFAGRAFKIAYHLVIGIEVDIPLSSGSSGSYPDTSRRISRERKSKVLKVPIRVWGEIDGTLVEHSRSWLIILLTL